MRVVWEGREGGAHTGGCLVKGGVGLCAGAADGITIQGLYSSALNQAVCPIWNQM
jgi:hypothetical protein